MIFQRPWFPPAFWCLLLVICTGCGSKKRHAWQTYNSAGGGFSVLLPGTPKLTQKVEVTPYGRQTVYYVTWKPGAMDIYKITAIQISYTDCPRGLENDQASAAIKLDSSIKLRQREFSERDFLSESISLNGYPGRAFFYDPPHANTTVAVKQCIANGRAYELIVYASSNQGTNQEIADFYNSFQVLR